MRKLIARLEEAKSVDTPNLDNYIKMQIFRDKMSKDTASGRLEIFNQVDSDLSPENITWDGERPASEVRKAAKFLNQVMKELIALDPSLRNRPYG